MPIEIINKIMVKQLSKSMPKAALFDLDGVVFDTEPLYTRFWQEEGKRYHPEIPDFAYRIKGQTLVEIYERYFSQWVEEQPLITERLLAYEANMQYTYVANFESFARGLHELGVKMAVVTSSNKEKMARVYKAHPELKEYFDAILTSEDFTRSKPDPDCYLKGAAVFGVRPDECVGFEDSFNGLKAVRAAGMPVIGLATTNSEEAIRPYCDLVIKDYTNWTHKILPFI